MQSLPRIYLLNLFFLIFICSGCIGGEAYILDADEFDRGSSKYLYGIEDRSVVTICSSKIRGEPNKASEIAQNECALFGKSAKFDRYSFSQCPLMTPRATIFNCVVDKKELRRLN